MRKILTRLTTLICAVAVTATTLPPFDLQVSAKTYDATVLKWDFEDKSDIGYYYQGQTENEERKVFESGAWCREAGTWNGTEYESYMRPVQTTISSTGQSLSNGGTYCAGLTMISAENNRRSLGMAIMLSDKELIPNRQYTLEFDVYNNLTWERFVYAGFSSPSDRTTSTRTCDSDGAQWLSNDDYCEQVTIDNEEKKGVSNTKWSHATVTITPPEELYENGHIILYIAGSNWLKEYVAGNEKIYFDNITITPVEAVVDKPIYSKLNYGRMWDFEERAADDEVWAPLSDNGVPGTDIGMVPTYISTDDVKMYKDSLANHGYNGAEAPGSKECMSITTGTASNYIVGTKIRLSKNEFRNGTYKLELRAAASSAVYDLHAAIFKGTTDIATVDLSSEGDVVEASLAAAVTDINMGVLGTYWSRYTADISLSEYDFDENGYCTLAIYSGVGLMDSRESLFLDDISLTAEIEPNIEKGGCVTGYLTTVADYELDTAMTIVAVKEDEVLKGMEIFSGGLRRINYINFSVAVPEDIEIPTVKLYMWDGKNMIPLDSVKDVGVEYTEAEVNYRWLSEWTDVLGTRYDESQSPTEQADDSKTSKITVNEDEDIALTATVYDSDGVIYSSGVGKESFEIEVPSEGDYTVTLEATNREKLIQGTVGIYTKAEFEKLTAYPIAAVSDSDTVAYRASFEYEYLANCAVTEGAKYTFSDNLANGGRKCLYVSDRTSSQGIELSAPRLAGATADITAYVRNDDSVAANTTKRYLLRAVITSKSGATTEKNLNMILLKGSGMWSKITASADFSSYTADSISDIKIYLMELSATPFYVDDLLITSNGNRHVNDDMEYCNYALDMISDTPYVASTNPEEIGVDEQLPALKDVFKDYFKIGGCNNNQMCGYDADYAKVFWKNFNTTVADGSFKLDWLCQDGYDKPYFFETADMMMHFCYQNGLTDIIGHNLMSNTNPMERATDERGELLDRDETLAQMKEHIEYMMDHFNGKGDAREYWSELTYNDYKNWHINTWDVVNEPAGNKVDAHGFGAYRCEDDGVNTVGYCKLVGTDYVQYAYKYAREADPTAELRLNDFEDWSVKRENIIKVVSDLNAQNNIVGGEQLVDKIGYQCHFTPDMEPAYLRDSVAAFVGTGLPLDITEIDIKSHSFEPNEAGLKMFEGGITKMREFEQAMLLKGAFEIFKEFSENIDRVTFWTFTDKYSYHNNTRIDFAGIFDRNFNPKPAYWAIVSTEEEFYERYPEAKLLLEKTEWHFDYISDVTYSFDMGAWTRIDPDLYEHQPIREEDGNGGYYLKCKRRWRTNDNEGIRIKLSKEQMQPGKKYSISFKAKVQGETAETESGRDLYAAVAVPSARVIAGTGPAEFITSGIRCGTSSVQWKNYSAEFTPTIEDYENGYTSLYLSMPGGMLSGVTANLCFDDIKIEEIN